VRRAAEWRLAAVRASVAMAMGLAVCATRLSAQEAMFESSPYIADDLPAGTSVSASMEETELRSIGDWFDRVLVGYDNGFVIAGTGDQRLDVDDAPFSMRINGWGQFRHYVFDSATEIPDQNQFVLSRARLIFSGNVLNPSFTYFAQIDGRSGDGDLLRLLDYYLAFDLGRYLWDLEPGSIGFSAGKFKVPFTLARYLSSRVDEFTDRSMASTYFDANRSIGCKLYGRTRLLPVPLQWETSLFNGLVTGGAETGSDGELDNNLAYSLRLFAFPTGDWGTDSLADFEWHEQIATRVGAGFATSTIDRDGQTEWNAIRVVDSGDTLGSILPLDIDQYTVSMFCMDSSCKYLGWSATLEYYFRNINDFGGGELPSLFDQGFWLQCGRFLIPEKLQVLARWSRVQGNSGTLGQANQSAEEISGAIAWYFHGQNAKFVCDLTHLDGAPIDSTALNIYPGDAGWLFRSQLQVAF
jgi:hypothetical protein